MKLIFTLFLLIVIYSTNFGQDCCNHDKGELKHGIQFQVTDLLNISNYRGYTFSYRYLLNCNSGIRLGITSNYNNQDDDRNVLLNNSEYDAPYTSSSFHMKLSIQYLKQF